MATDPKTMPDHPVNLLRNHYAPQHPITSSVYTTAAGALEGYEQVNGVTFAALDNETLERLFEAYERVATSGPGAEKDFAEVDLAEAVRDLFGLGD